MATICNKCNKVCRVHYGTSTQEVAQCDTHFARERVLVSECCEATVRVAEPPAATASEARAATRHTRAEELGEELRELCLRTAVWNVFCEDDEGRSAGELLALLGAHRDSDPGDFDLSVDVVFEGENCGWLFDRIQDEARSLRGVVDEALRRADRKRLVTVRVRGCCSVGDAVEPCSMEEAEFFGLYVAFNDAPSEHVADFPSYAKARRAGERLAKCAEATLFDEVADVVAHYFKTHT